MARKGSEIVDIEVELLHTRPLAWLVRSSDTGKQAWVPRSIGELEAIAGQGRMHTLTMPTALAQDKELI